MGRQNSSGLAWSGSFWGEGEPQLGNFYFDNYHVRVLLGSKAATSLPWGTLRNSHLRIAKAKLASFDIVVPLQFLPDAFPDIRQILGTRFDFSASSGWAERTNVRRAPP